MLRLVQKSAAEAVGTFTLVFVGCGTAILAKIQPGTIDSFQISLSFGMAVSAMIYAVGHISGAHFNPVVTLAFSFSKHFPVKHVFAYWLSQSLGSVLAIGLLSLLFPDARSIGETIPHVSTIHALGWEITLTFLLVFVIIAVSTDARAKGVMAGAAIGSTVTFCAFLGGPFTGASMNPARSLGPAIVSGHFENFWIYIIGPAVGALLASLIYRFIRCESHQQSPGGCCP